MKCKSDFKKYCKYEAEIYKKRLVCLFVCSFDFCHRNDLKYKLNILGPLCLWQCLHARSLLRANLNRLVWYSTCKKYFKYEDEIYKNILFVCLCVFFACLLACLFVCLFVCLFDFCHKNDLNYKLNNLGPLCLWQGLGNFFY